MKSQRDLLHNIISKNVKDVEIGTMVSSKTLPQLNDSIELFKYAKSIGMEDIHYYMLFPNSKNVLQGVQAGVQNFSLFTSISDAFLRKNIHKTLDEIKDDLDQSLQLLASKKNDIENIKLYVSCINECPIEGRLSTTNIIHELITYYYEYDNITNICLSDTCGTLSPSILEEIIHRIKLEGIDIGKISLHIHSNDNDKNRLQSILDISLNNDIQKFDISLLDTCGDSFMNNKKKVVRHLNYNDINSYLHI
tara:strand:+ start:2038 stop:2787 length:750 start_codon:yes stop_codon:yes gene_type:complete